MREEQGYGAKAEPEGDDVQAVMKPVLLLTPGPTPIHPRAQAALHWPMRGHMDPEIFAYNDKIVSDLHELYGTAAGAFTSLLSGTGSMGMEAGFANLLPTSVAVRLARQQVETVDFATSNVRGAPFPLFIAGARILANYPIGPTGGTAWNLTLMSYDGSLDMGLNADAGAVADPAMLRDAIEAEFAALIAAGSPKVARRRKAGG